MEPTTLALLAAAAWMLLRGKSAASATPATASKPAATKPKPAAKPKSRVVTVPEILITAPVPAAAKPPLSVTQPVSSTAIPWQAVEQKILARQETASTKAKAIPVPMVMREDGQAVKQDEGAAMIARERAPFDKSYWMSVAKVTPAEVAQAKAYMSIWQKGGVWYDGPRTFAGRRQYRATDNGGKHGISVWQPKPPFR